MTASRLTGAAVVAAVFLVLLSLALSPIGPAQAAEQLHILSQWAGNVPEHFYWDGAQWQGWNAIGGKLITSPPGVASYRGQLHLFATGQDQHLYQAIWDGAAWNGWFDLSCCFATVAATDYFGFLIVVAQGADNSLYLAYFDPNASKWNGWFPVATNVFGRPAVVTYNGQLHLFMVAGDDNYYQYFWDGQKWNGFFQIGGPFASGPGAALYHNQIHVFGPGFDGNLYQEYFDGQSWARYFNLGAPPNAAIQGSVGAAPFGSDLLLAVVRGADSSLYIRVLGGNFGSQYFGPLGQAVSGPGAASHQGGSAGGGSNHPPTFGSLAATRLVHSFGRDDASRAAGIKGRPGVDALEPLLAPPIVTLSGAGNPIVTAGAALASCCTLLVAEGAADPDGNPVSFQWQAVTGTFYSTGSTGSGGFPYGAKITDITLYTRNSVFWEAPSIGFPILFWNLMGGLTNVGVHVTDIPASGPPLASATQFLALEWGRTLHLDLTYVTSHRLAANDPHYPNGIEMEFLAAPQGSFNPGALPMTVRFECGGRDNVVLDQPLVPGVPFKCHYHSDEEGAQITVTAVATVGGGFISPPDGPGLDRWKSLGCTVGSTDTELVKLPTVVSCNDNQVAGGDTADTRFVELGKTAATFVFDFDTFSIQDRIVVSHDGTTLFDTGCVGSSGSQTLSYSGGSTGVTVQVFPNCSGGTSGTAWQYTVHCPQ